MIIPSALIICIYFIFNLFRTGTIPSFAFLSWDFLFYLIICALLLYSIIANNKGRLFQNSGDDYQIIENQFTRFNEYYKSTSGTRSGLDKLVVRTERKDFLSADKTSVVDCMEILFKTEKGHYLIIYDITNRKIRRGTSIPDAQDKRIPFNEFDIESRHRRPYDYRHRGDKIYINTPPENKDMDKEALGNKKDVDDGKRDKPE